MSAGTGEEDLSRLFQTLGQPVRLRILQAIGEGEACVCHLEAVLGQRQAFISQHLMVLREAKVLRTRRDGRYIFYSLLDQKILDLVQLSAEIAGGGESMQFLQSEQPGPVECACPTCAPVT